MSQDSLYGLKFGHAAPSDCSTRSETRGQALGVDAKVAIEVQARGRFPDIYGSVAETGAYYAAAVRLDHQKTFASG